MITSKTNFLETSFFLEWVFSFEASSLFFFFLSKNIVENKGVGVIRQWWWKVFLSFSISMGVQLEIMEVQEEQKAETLTWLRECINYTQISRGI